AAQTSSTQSAPVIPERPVVSIDVSTPRSITKPDAVSRRFSLPGIVSTGPSVASLVQPVSPASTSGSTTSVQTKTSSSQALDPTWIGPTFSIWSIPSNWTPATVPNGAGVIADFRPSVANPNQM